MDKQRVEAEEVLNGAGLEHFGLQPLDPVNLIKTGAAKIKVKQEFIMLFVENFQRLVPILTKNELKVMLSILKFMTFANVFSVTQKAISADSGVPLANVSRAMTALKKWQILSFSKEGVGHINPYIFSKGKLLEVKKTLPQLSFVFENSMETEKIKNPF